MAWYKFRRSDHVPLEVRVKQDRWLERQQAYQHKATIAAATLNQAKPHSFQEVRIEIPATSFNIQELAKYIRNSDGIRFKHDGKDDTLRKHEILYFHTVNDLEQKLKLSRSNPRLALSREENTNLKDARKLFEKDLSRRLANAALIVEAGETIPPGLSRQNQGIWESKCHKQVPLTTALHAPQ